MSPEYEKKLEERIHQELAKVPERSAPADLFSNVMTAIAEREARPWWRKPIPQWPRNNQTVFVAVMLAFVLGAGVGLWQLWPHEVLQEIPTQAAAAVEPIRPVWSVMETLGRAGAVMVKSITQPWLIALGVAFLFLYLSCIGMGMAWYRVTFQKGSISNA
jgi:hypothetical protein